MIIECFSLGGGTERSAIRPSHTKLLLTKRYSENKIFSENTNLTCNSLKNVFPGHVESIESLKNYAKYFSGL